VLRMDFYKQTPGKLSSSCTKCFTQRGPGTVASSKNGYSLASLGAGEFFWEIFSFEISMDGMTL
jgi:hypothetical protein